MKGALIGLAIGMMSYAAIRYAAEQIEASQRTLEPSRTAGLLRVVAVADLILMPVIGYFVWPTVIE